eukprot:8243123-Alexandrium_andersonii.AAC.1
MVDHPSLFSPYWRRGDGATTTSEGGDVPEDWSDYVGSLNRADRWADGLMLLAAAEHVSRRIVVLQEQDGQWCVRKSLAPLTPKRRTAADREAAWVLAWKEDHFYAVDMIAGSMPAAWSFPSGDR